MNRFCLRLGLIGLAMAVIAYGLIHRAGAASYIVPAEAESGTVSTTAKIVEDSAASNGKAIAFRPAVADCLPIPNGKMLDQDPSDDPNKPWQRSTPELVIYFETGKLPAEYAEYARKAAANWSVSECVDAHVVATCPAKVICVPMAMTDESDGTTTGKFSSTFNDTYLLTGSIKFYHKTLDDDPSDERQMTVAHEVGHALSQNHRLSKKAIMYTPSSGKNSFIPDDTDLHNLRVVYGKSLAAQAPSSGAVVSGVDEH